MLMWRIAMSVACFYLETVDELLDIGLMSRSAEDILLEGRLLVELQNQDEKWSWQLLRLATHLFQRHTEFHSASFRTYGIRRVEGLLLIGLLTYRCDSGGVWKEVEYG